MHDLFRKSSQVRGGFWYFVYFVRNFGSEGGRDPYGHRGRAWMSEGGTSSYKKLYFYIYIYSDLRIFSCGNRARTVQKACGNFTAQFDLEPERVTALPVVGMISPQERRGVEENGSPMRREINLLPYLLFCVVGPGYQRNFAQMGPRKFTQGDPENSHRWDPGNSHRWDPENSHRGTQKPEKVVREKRGLSGTGYPPGSRKNSSHGSETSDERHDVPVLSPFVLV